MGEVLALVYADKSLEERPITFSPIHMDVQKNGATLTLSMPIMGGAEEIDKENTTSHAPRFVGVAGVDVKYSEMKRILEEEAGAGMGNPHTHSYAFLMDNNGMAYYHLNLKLPPKEVYAVRRTACHKMAFFHRSGTRVQFGRSGERINKMMGLIDSIPTMDIMELDSHPSATLEKLRRIMIDGKVRRGQGCAPSGFS